MKKKRTGAVNRRTKMLLRKSVRNVITGLVVAVVIFSTIVFSARSAGDASVSNIVDVVSLPFNARSTGGFPYNADGENISKIAVMGNCIAAVGDKNTRVLTPRAKLAADIPLNYRSPKIKTMNGRALVYDSKGTSAQLLSRTEVLASVTVEGEIITAVPGRNGCFAVAYDSKDSGSSLTVFSKGHKNIFEWNCAGERILDVAFSYDCKKIAVLCLGAKNAAAYSRIVVFSLTAEQPLFDRKCENTMFVRINYTGNALCAVGDSRFTVYDSNFAQIEDTKYSEDTLRCIAFDENGNTIIGLASSGGGKTDIISFDRKGGKRYDITVDAAIEGACSSGRKTAFLCGRTVLVYSSDGRMLREIPLEEEPLSWTYTGNKVYSVAHDGLNVY